MARHPPHHPTDTVSSLQSRWQRAQLPAARLLHRNLAGYVGNEENQYWLDCLQICFYPHLPGLTEDNSLGVWRAAKTGWA